MQMMQNIIKIDGLHYWIEPLSPASVPSSHLE